MLVALKRKYTVYMEPDGWKGRTGPKMKNYQKGGNHSNHQGTKRTKNVLKPLGFSGRTCSRMIRRHDPKVKK